MVGFNQVSLARHACAIIQCIAEVQKRSQRSQNRPSAPPILHEHAHVLLPALARLHEQLSHLVCGDALLLSREDGSGGVRCEDLDAFCAWWSDSRCSAMIVRLLGLALRDLSALMEPLRSDAPQPRAAADNRSDASTAGDSEASHKAAAFEQYLNTQQAAQCASALGILHAVLQLVVAAVQLLRQRPAMSLQPPPPLPPPPEPSTSADSPNNDNFANPDGTGAQPASRSPADPKTTTSLPSPTRNGKHQRTAASSNTSSPTRRRAAASDAHASATTAAATPTRRTTNASLPALRAAASADDSPATGPTSSPCSPNRRPHSPRLPPPRRMRPEEERYHRLAARHDQAQRLYLSWSAYQDKLMDLLCNTPLSSCISEVLRLASPLLSASIAGPPLPTGLAATSALATGRARAPMAAALAAAPSAPLTAVYRQTWSLVPVVAGIVHAMAGAGGESLTPTQIAAGPGGGGGARALDARSAAVLVSALAESELLPRCCEAVLGACPRALAQQAAVRQAAALACQQLVAAAAQLCAVSSRGGGKEGGRAGCGSSSGSGEAEDGGSEGATPREGEGTERSPSLAAALGGEEEGAVGDGAGDTGCATDGAKGSETCAKAAGRVGSTEPPMAAAATAAASMLSTPAVQYFVLERQASAVRQTYEELAAVAEDVAEAAEDAAEAADAVAAAFASLASPVRLPILSLNLAPPMAAGVYSAAAAPPAVVAAEAVFGEDGSAAAALSAEQVLQLIHTCGLQLLPLPALPWVVTVDAVAEHAPDFCPINRTTAGPGMGREAMAVAAAASTANAVESSPVSPTSAAPPALHGLRSGPSSHSIVHSPAGVLARRRREAQSAPSSPSGARLAHGALPLPPAGGAPGSRLPQIRAPPVRELEALEVKKGVMGRLQRAQVAAEHKAQLVGLVKATATVWGQGGSGPSGRSGGRGAEFEEEEEQQRPETPVGQVRSAARAVVVMAAVAAVCRAVPGVAAATGTAGAAPAAAGLGRSRGGFGGGFGGGGPVVLPPVDAAGARGVTVAEEEAEAATAAALAGLAGHVSSALARCRERERRALQGHAAGVLLAVLGAAQDLLSRSSNPDVSTPLLPVADAALALLADVQRTCAVQRTVWERDADELDEHSYYEDDEQGEQEGAARAAALAVAAAREGPQLAAAAALCECCVRFLMAHHGAVLGTLDGAGLLRPGLKLRPEHTRHAELLQQSLSSLVAIAAHLSACFAHARHVSTSAPAPDLTAAAAALDAALSRAFAPTTRALYSSLLTVRKCLALCSQQMALAGGLALQLQPVPEVCAVLCGFPGRLAAAVLPVHELGGAAAAPGGGQGGPASGAGPAARESGAGIAAGLDVAQQEEGTRAGSGAGERGAGQAEEVVGMEEDAEQGEEGGALSDEEADGAEEEEGVEEDGEFGLLPIAETGRERAQSGDGVLEEEVAAAAAEEEEALEEDGQAEDIAEAGGEEVEEDEEEEGSEGSESSVLDAGDQEDHGGYGAGEEQEYASDLGAADGGPMPSASSFAGAEEPSLAQMPAAGSNGGDEDASALGGDAVADEAAAVAAAAAAAARVPYVSRAVASCALHVAVPAAWRTFVSLFLQLSRVELAGGRTAEACGVPERPQDGTSSQATTPRGEGPGDGGTGSGDGVGGGDGGSMLSKEQRAVLSRAAAGLWDLVYVLLALQRAGARWPAGCFAMPAGTDTAVREAMQRLREPRTVVFAAASVGRAAGSGMQAGAEGSEGGGRQEGEQGRGGDLGAVGEGLGCAGAESGKGGEDGSDREGSVQARRTGGEEARGVGELAETGNDAVVQGDGGVGTLDEGAPAEGDGAGPLPGPQVAAGAPATEAQAHQQVAGRKQEPGGGPAVPSQQQPKPPLVPQQQGPAGSAVVLLPPAAEAIAEWREAVALLDQVLAMSQAWAEYRAVEVAAAAAVAAAAVVGPRGASRAGWAVGAAPVEAGGVFASFAPHSAIGAAARAHAVGGLGGGGGGGGAGEPSAAELLASFMHGGGGLSRGPSSRAVGGADAGRTGGFGHKSGVSQGQLHQQLLLPAEECVRALQGGAASPVRLFGPGTSGLLGCCGNVGCTRLGGVSELAVGGVVVCACREVSYCCAACRQQHWAEGHAAVCRSQKRLGLRLGLGQQGGAAARAGVGAGPVGGRGNGMGGGGTGRRGDGVVLRMTGANGTARR